MTAVALDGDSVWAHSGDTGASQAALLLRKIIKSTEDDLRSANSWNMFGETYSVLREIYLECSKLSWDGYGAAPIFAAAYEEAVLFLKSLPNNIPRPEVIPEVDGSIGFEWENGANRIFVVSLSGKGNIVYAGMFRKGTKAHGTEIFDEKAPEEIIEKIRRIYR